MKKILIVDDEVLTRTGIHYLCDWEQFGFTIIGEAENGKDALKLVNQSVPDIILTDIRMPVMDGLSFIKIIHQKYPQIKLFVLSGYNDFESVRQAFKEGVLDFFLKTDLDATQMIQAFSSEFSTQNVEEKAESVSYLLLKFLLSGCISHKEMFQTMIDHNISFIDGKPFFLFSGRSIQNELSSQQILSQLNTQNLPFPYASGISNQGVFYMLIQCEKESLSTIKNIFMSSIIPKDTIYYIVISNSFVDLSDLPNIMIEINELHEYDFYFPKTNILQADHFYPSTMFDFQFKQYVELLETNQFDEAKHQISDYIQKVNEGKCLPEYSFKKNLQEYFILMFQSLAKQLPPSPSFMKIKMEVLKTIDQSPNSDTLVVNLESSLDIIKTIYQDTIYHQYNEQYNKLYHYIFDHCTEDLKLSDVAKEIHLNYNYASTLFHRISKVTFTEYLQNIRIKKAKKLIAETPTQIPNLYLDVGFSNQSYFIKIFKKYSGCTPKQYYLKTHEVNRSSKNGQ